MRYLLQFVWRFHFFFLFLFLEAIAFFMLFNSNPYQRSKSWTTINELNGEAFAQASNLREYFHLREINESLLAENARLNEKLASAPAASDSLIPHHNQNSFEYIPANITSNSVNRMTNYLILDKGKNDGVHKDMGVLSSRGIAGIVIGISQNHSIAMSLLHKNFRLSAKIQTNGQLVNLVWQKPDYQRAQLTDIPAHVQLNSGDTIISSGYSHIFPPGIAVGTVEKVYDVPGSSFKTAEIKLLTDFNSLHKVYLIHNFHRDTLIELEKQFTDD